MNNEAGQARGAAQKRKEAPASSVGPQPEAQRTNTPGNTAYRYVKNIWENEGRERCRVARAGRVGGSETYQHSPRGRVTPLRGEGPA
jgi:hypothetical protein